MKFLIITQKIDKTDSVLGFFCDWAFEFAKRSEKITIICLERGSGEFPENVKVLSLGKENGASRIKYLWRFYRYIWSERKKYDTVFVHMNQEYVLLGGIFWKLFGKKIWLWRNHPMGSFATNVAVFLSDKVFCTSPYSYTARFKKTELMPVGVNTEIFTRIPSIRKIKNSILFLGRISSIKNPLVFVEALRILHEKEFVFHATIAGDPAQKDIILRDELKRKIAEYGLAESIALRGGMTNAETVKMYNLHEIYVNLTPTGSMDKTILEAMACEETVIVANRSFKNVLPDAFLCDEKNPSELAEKLEQAFSLSEKKREELGKKMRDCAETNSLSRLSQSLFSS